MHFIDLLNSKKLKIKIIILFVLILILPLAILTIISLNRTYIVAENNINKDLNNSVTLFRENLEDILDTLMLRTKTFVDFEIDKLVLNNFPEKETLLQFNSELVKCDLDYLALVENQTYPKYQVGNFSSDTLNHISVLYVCPDTLHPENLSHPISARNQYHHQPVSAQSQKFHIRKRTQPLSESFPVKHRLLPQ